MIKKKRYITKKKNFFFLFKYDPKYSSFFFSKFINSFVQKGKKLKGIFKFLTLFKNLKRNLKKNPYLIFLKYILLYKPSFILKKTKIAGQTIWIPFPINYFNSIKYSIKSLYNAIIKNTETTSFLKKSILEFLNFFLLKKKTNFIKNFEDHHEQITLNNQNSHYRWK